MLSIKIKRKVNYRNTEQTELDLAKQEINSLKEQLQEEKARTESLKNELNNVYKKAKFLLKKQNEINNLF